MPYTNKLGLSPEVIKWLLVDEYDYIPGVISATTIVDPVRKTILMERHRDEITVDVESFVDRRLGQAVHSSFEAVDYSDENIIVETRFQHHLNGVRISGKPDMLVPVGAPDSKLFRIRDIKTASVWAIVYGDRIKDWAWQLSIYKYILHHNGFNTVDVGKMIVILKDWSESEGVNNDKYPPGKIHEPEITLHSLEDTEGYLRSRLQAIMFGRDLEDDKLPNCTMEDVWFKPGNDASLEERSNGKFAHMRAGSSRAVKLYDDRDECQDVVDKDCLGSVKRCPKYCSVHPFCTQYQQMRVDGIAEPPEED